MLELIEAGRSFRPPFIEISEGLVGYWRMEEASYNGTPDEVIDRSGLGNHGFALNGATTTAAGKMGRGLELDGVNQYIDCGNDTSLALTEWTMATWVYRAVAGTNWNRIISKSDATDEDYFLTTSISGDLAVGFRNIAGGSLYLLAGTVPTGSWTHAVGTFDGTYIRNYVNGVLVGTSGNLSAQTPRTSSRDLWIGRETSIYNLNGTVDEVAIWMRALAAEEIQTVYDLTAVLLRPLPESIELPLEVTNISPNLEVMAV